MIRRLAVFSVLMLMAVFFPAVLSPAQAAEDDCADPADVPFVIEFGELKGEDQILCAKDATGVMALDALEDLGVDFAMTTGSNPMLCRIDDQPAAAEESCGEALDGKGYWAFLMAQDGVEWSYAAVGLAELPLGEGDFVALRYHLMSAGMDVPVSVEANAETRAQAVVPTVEKAPAESRSGIAPAQIAIFVVGGIVLLGLVVLLAVRRRSES